MWFYLLSHTHILYNTNILHWMQMFRISVKIVHGSVQVKVVRRPVQMYELCELRMPHRRTSETRCTKPPLRSKGNPAPLEWRSAGWQGTGWCYSDWATFMQKIKNLFNDVLEKTWKLYKLYKKNSSASALVLFFWAFLNTCRFAIYG